MESAILCWQWILVARNDVQIEFLEVIEADFEIEIKWESSTRLSPVAYRAHKRLFYYLSKSPVHDRVVAQENRDPYEACGIFGLA